MLAPPGLLDQLRNVCAGCQVINRQYLLEPFVLVRLAWVAGRCVLRLQPVQGLGGILEELIAGVAQARADAQRCDHSAFVRADGQEEGDQGAAGLGKLRSLPGCLVIHHGLGIAQHVVQRFVVNHDLSILALGSPSFRRSLFRTS